MVQSSNNLGMIIDSPVFRHCALPLRNSETPETAIETQKVWDSVETGGRLWCHLHDAGFTCMQDSIVGQKGLNLHFRITLGRSGSVLLIGQWVRL